MWKSLLEALESTEITEKEKPSDSKCASALLSSSAFKQAVSAFRVSVSRCNLPELHKLARILTSSSILVQSRLFELPLLGNSDKEFGLFDGLIRSDSPPTLPAYEERDPFRLPRWDTEQDVLTKGVLSPLPVIDPTTGILGPGNPLPLIVCSRCEGRAEKNPTGFFAGPMNASGPNRKPRSAAYVKWNSWINRWRARCLCGGRWSAVTS